MKKLFFRILLSLSIPMLFVGTVSYYADPGEIFHDSSSLIVNVLYSKKNVAINLIPSNWSGIQIEMVKQFKQDNYLPHTVIWGNSRSSEIADEYAQPHTFFNHILPGANVLDYVSLLGLYKQEHSLPQTLILSIDPMLFYGTKGSGEFFVRDTSLRLTPRKGLELYCRKGLSILDTTGSLSKHFPICRATQTFRYKASMLFMPDYFQTSLRSIGKKNIIPITETEKEGYFIIRKDGGYSIANTDWINDAQVAARTERFVQATGGSYFCDDCIHSDYYHLLKTLLIYLSQHEKRKVVLFFAPIHLIAYQQFSQKEKLLLEKDCKHFADSLQIEYIGSFNPSDFGLDKKPKSFLDEMHPSKEAMKAILVQKLP